MSVVLLEALKEQRQQVQQLEKRMARMEALLAKLVGEDDDQLINDGVAQA